MHPFQLWFFQSPCLYFLRPPILLKKQHIVSIPLISFPVPTANNHANIPMYIHVSVKRSSLEHILFCNRLLFMLAFSQTFPRVQASDLEKRYQKAPILEFSPISFIFFMARCKKKKKNQGFLLRTLPSLRTLFHFSMLLLYSPKFHFSFSFSLLYADFSIPERPAFTNIKNDER